MKRWLPMVVLSMAAGPGPCDAELTPAQRQAMAPAYTCADCVRKCDPMPVALCYPAPDQFNYATCYCGPGPITIERVR